MPSGGLVGESDLLPEIGVEVPKIGGGKMSFLGRDLGKGYSEAGVVPLVGEKGGDGSGGVGGIVVHKLGKGE